MKLIPEAENQVLRLCRREMVELHQALTESIYQRDQEFDIVIVEADNDNHPNRK